MILSSEPGVQASVLDDLELSCLKVFVLANAYPGQGICVCHYDLGTSSLLSPDRSTSLV